MPTTRISRTASWLCLTGAAFLAADALAQTRPGTVPSSACPEEGAVQHWDKVIFEIQKDGSGLVPDSLLKTELDLKFVDPPGVVVSLKAVIADHLAQQLGAPSLDPDDLKIAIIDVRYETVNCGFSGPPGPAGPTGPTGPAGVPNTYYKYSHGGTLNSNGQLQIEVLCNKGDLATGGGVGTLGGRLDKSAPSPVSGAPMVSSPNGWNALLRETSAADIWVVCLDVTP